jgi:hypothetical protein
LIEVGNPRANLTCTVRTDRARSVTQSSSALMLESASNVAIEQLLKPGPLREVSQSVERL